MSTLSAQQIAKSDLIKISSPKPNSIQKFKIGEFLKVEVRYHNNTNSEAIISAIPYAKGQRTGNGGYRPASVEPKGRGTIQVSFTCRESTAVDEVRVVMAEKGTFKELAAIGVLVQMTWEDGKPASVPAQNTAPPKKKSISAPAPAPGSQPGMLKFELQGYEVSQDIAASLFIAHPNELDPQAMLTATATLVGAHKATLVKLPFITAFSRARAFAAPIGGYSLEGVLTLGADKRTVEIIYALRRASDNSGSINSVSTRVGGVTFIGSQPGSSADKVILIFSRLTLL